MEIIPNELFLTDIIKKIKSKKLIRRYFMMILSLFISSLVFNLLILPTNIVSGGVNGISIILKHLYGFSPSIVILVTSVILLIFSLMYLGVERTSGTVVATFVYPFFVTLTSNLAKYITIEVNDIFLIAIFIGFLGGVANGIMYKTGFSNGGLPIISQILYEKFKIPISKSSLIINGIIVIIGGVFFGWTMVMYALIVLYINSFMLDKVILGVSKNKAFYIITNEDLLVKNYIIEKLGHSVTVFDVKGGFLEKKRKVLLTVIPTREYFSVTEGIKSVDSNAFFLACDAYQVEGGK